MATRSTPVCCPEFQRPPSSLCTAGHTRHAIRRPSSTTRWRSELADAIEFDFEKFGRKGQEMALRSLAFDRAAIQYLTKHPTATVVALAEGLQTSYWRLDKALPSAEFRWLSIDLAPVIELRRQLLPSPDAIRTPRSPRWTTPGWTRWTPRRSLHHRGRPADVLAARRGDGTDPTVRQAISGAQMIFDLPPVLVKKFAPKGLRSSSRYRVPPMPFSLSASQLADLANTVPGIRP